MNKFWQSNIPMIPKNKNRKRCYSMWTTLPGIGYGGGKIVWLTDQELMLANIKYSNTIFELVLEKDKLEQYKKYINATID